MRKQGPPADREPSAPTRSPTTRPPSLPARGPAPKKLKSEVENEPLAPNPKRQCWACARPLKRKTVYYCQPCYARVRAVRRARRDRRLGATQATNDTLLVVLFGPVVAPVVPFDAYDHFQSMADMARYERPVKILRFRPQTVPRLARRLGVSSEVLMGLP